MPTGPLPLRFGRQGVLALAPPQSPSSYHAHRHQPNPHHTAPHPKKIIITNTHIPARLSPPTKPTIHTRTTPPNKTIKIHTRTPPSPLTISPHHTPQNNDDPDARPGPDPRLPHLPGRPPAGARGTGEAQRHVPGREEWREGGWDEWRVGKGQRHPSMHQDEIYMLKHTICFFLN